MNLKVAVVLINYKDYAKRFLTECRDSLRVQTYPIDRFTVYIVDNAGDVETQKYLAECYPEAKIVPRPDGNYSAGNNAGINAARQDGITLFAIANMDTRFDPDWLAELVKVVLSAPDIGIVQSKLLLYPQTEEEWKDPLVNSLGNIQHYLGFGYTSGYRQKVSSCANMQEISPIAGYASGCALIVRDEVLKKIGDYNENFYMYHDDVELSWRAKLAGYRIVLAPRSIVYHKYEFNRSMRMYYYMERNRYLVLFNFYRWRTLLLIAPMLFVMEFGVLGFSAFRGGFLTKLRVYWYYLKPTTWLHVWKTRRAVTRFRRVTDSAVLNTMSGRLDFSEVNNWILINVGNPICELYFYLIKKIIVW